MSKGESGVYVMDSSYLGKANQYPTRVNSTKGYREKNIEKRKGGKMGEN